jgi:hypothetical protein
LLMLSNTGSKEFGLFSSAANLKFPSALLQVRHRSFKFKAATHKQ